MLLTFRQGIVQHDVGGFLSVALSYVSLDAPSPVTITFAHGSKDYLHHERETVPNAWGPITPSVDQWLYWDLNTITSNRTFGITLLEPVVASTAPTPATDQHWFDSTTKTMKVWSGTRWVEKIRVFACLLSNGAVPISMSINSPAFTGTQVGITSVTSLSGQILVDATSNKAIRNFEGKFMTSEDRIRVPTLSGSDVKFASLIVEAEAQENLAAYTVVNFSAFGKVVHATSFVANLPAPLGIVQQNALTGDVVSVTTEGAITNPSWDWTAVGVNAPLYCNNTGVLTTTEQFPGQAPVAVVIDKKTILVGKSKVTTSVTNTSLDSLTDVIITTPSTDQALVYDGVNWINQDVVAGGGTPYIDVLSTGTLPTVSDTEAIAIGAGSVANGIQSIAMGFTASAMTQSSIAIGSATVADGGDNNTLIGSSSTQSGGSYTVGVGTAITQSGGGGGVAIGNFIDDTGGGYNIVIGAGVTESGGNDNIVIGHTAVETGGNDNIVIGHEAASYAGTSNIVIGSFSSASSSGSEAPTVNNSVLIGNEAVSLYSGVVVIGAASATEDNEIILADGRGAIDSVKIRFDSAGRTKPNAAIVPKVITLTPVTGVVTIDTTLGNTFEVTVTEDTTLEVAGAILGTSFTLFVNNNGTPRTITYGASFVDVFFIGDSSPPTTASTDQYYFTNLTGAWGIYQVAVPTTLPVGPTWINDIGNIYETEDIISVIDLAEIGNLRVRGGLVEHYQPLTSNTEIPVLQASLFTRTVIAPVTFTFSVSHPFLEDTLSDAIASFTFEIINSGGAHTITWPASVKWPDGIIPTPTTGVDVYTFYTSDEGVTWRGALAASYIS